MSALYVVFSFIKKEFKQIARSREMLIVLFALPAMQLMVMGFAVSNEVKNLSLSFFDYDRSPLSQELIQTFSNSDRFRLVPISPMDKPEQLIREWKSQIVIVIPNDFAKTYTKGELVTLQVLFDGIDGNTAAVAGSYVTGVVTGFHQNQMTKHGSSQLLHLPELDQRVELITRMSFNPDLKSSVNTIPGIIAVLVTVTSMLLSAISLVKEKELGTLEQLVVTPVKKHQLLAGKLIPYLIVTLLQLQVAIILAGFVFKISPAGSYFTLMMFSLIYLFTTLGIGILISTKVASQQQAMFFSWFIMIVFIFLSGFFVPVRNMPRGIQVISWFNPLSHYMTVLREIIIKGSTLAQLSRELIILLSSGFIVFGISVLSFRKRVN